MADVVSLDHTFGGLNSPVPLSYLDDNYGNLVDSLGDLNTFSNYLLDTGAVNAYVVTLGAGTTGALTNGLMIQVYITTANSGASTLNYNATGAKVIQNLDGSALLSGDLIAGYIYAFVWNSTRNAWGLLTRNFTRVLSTFTATATAGWTTTPTATVKYSLNGNVVTMDWPATMTGTSNATSATFSGVPAAIRPTVAKVLNGLRMIDNGGADSWGLLVLNTDGTGALYKDAAGSNWTNSGTKTIDSGSVTYTMA